MARAFIIRPFGTKDDINFDDVQKNLIAPALAACDIQGGTTEPFLEAGNIRADMFQQLLVADIVIADISIHNANVFYELGIRHALQPKRTLMLRAKNKKAPTQRTPQDEVPFDLRTDRYLEYDPDSPTQKLDVMIQALRQTLASEKPDSPVFQMLPDLEAQDRSRFLPVPQSFRDDVELASKRKQMGLLGLLAIEAEQFFWASEGLRLVGRAQFDLRAYRAAKETWEKLYKLNPNEAETNERLGTLYQRLGDLDSSDQALLRVINNKTASHADRAESFSLLGRNIKEKWRSSWISAAVDQAPRKALQSPLLLQAYEKYYQGFLENLDSFYAGLNALSLPIRYRMLGKRVSRRRPRPGLNLILSRFSDSAWRVQLAFHWKLRSSVCKRAGKRIVGSTLVSPILSFLLQTGHREWCSLMNPRWQEHPRFTQTRRERNSICSGN